MGEEDQRVAGLRAHGTTPAEPVGKVPLTDEGVDFDGRSQCNPEDSATGRLCVT